jgi:hypothetical protein
MGILNTSDGIYSMVAVLYRALARLGPMPRDELLSLCTAGIDTEHNGPKISAALRRWEELSLFQEREGKICIAAELPGVDLDDVAVTEHLRRSVLHVVFTPANVPDLWGTKGSADFARGLAWWMAQDCWRIDTAPGALQALETRQVPDEQLRVVNNGVRTGRLKEWAAFLGFAWSTTHSFELDPSAAIQRVLEFVLPEAGANVEAEEFLRRLAGALPVLDGGSYRVAVEERLNPAVWSATRPRWLSPTLGRALRRLSAANLKLERRADAHTSIKIPDSHGSDAVPWHEFSHISRVEGYA